MSKPTCRLDALGASWLVIACGSSASSLGTADATSGDALPVLVDAGADVLDEREIDSTLVEASTLDGNPLDAPVPDASMSDSAVADAGLAEAAFEGGVAIEASTDASTDATVDAPHGDGGGGVAQVDVLTQHGDVARTGANLQESILDVANVTSPKFGMLFARAVDDQTYAQPLIVSGVTLPSAGVHDLLVVATMNDTVYAFDADDPAQSAPLWKTSFLDADAGVAAVLHTDVGKACGTLLNISGNIGIESTPAIDRAAGTIYLVAKTKDASGTQTYALHALDLTTGLDRQPPAVIQASVAGTGAGASGGVVSFDASIENQRASLLLSGGTIYVAFGAYCGADNYHGWLLAYDAATLAQTAVLNTTPNGQGGGIWTSGEGPSTDANGNVYVTTAGGTADAPSGGSDFSEALLELTPSLGLVDWFVPSNYATLDANGTGYGSTGGLLVPGTRWIVTGSEAATLYVNDTSSLGQWSSGGDGQIVQSLSLGGTAIHGSPVATPRQLFVWGAGDTLRSYSITSQGLALAQTGPQALASGQPGGELALSANGSISGTAVLWVAQPMADASQATVPGILQAFDASDVTTEIWDSHRTAGDDCGSFAKFASPTVANGKVYLPSFSNQVCAYGLHP
jgi:hypothetical protein